MPADVTPAAAVTTIAPQAPATPAKSSRRRVILPLAALVALGLIGWYGLDYIQVGRFQVATDDAYVRADVTNIVVKVPGYITGLPVADNSVVTAGTVIAVIDEGDYKLALDQARAKAETQEATIARFDTQIAQQDAVIGQAEAGLVASEADARRADLDFTRYTQLTKDRYAAPQKLEQAEADRDRTRANVRSASDAIKAARAGRVVLVAQKQEAVRTLAELVTLVDKAKRDLEFTHVRAPADGAFGNRSLQLGSYAQSGSRLGALVQFGSLYVEANFKETQLRDLKLGMPVTVTVDALSGPPLKGIIESIAPGSGAIFSLLPPENATGNFTKIVQRVPLRIALEAQAQRLAGLRPGLSVAVSVNTLSSSDTGAKVQSPAVATSSK